MNLHQSWQQNAYRTENLESSIKYQASPHFAQRTPPPFSRPIPHFNERLYTAWEARGLTPLKLQGFAPLVGFPVVYWLTAGTVTWLRVRGSTAGKGVLPQTSSTTIQHRWFDAQMP